ncbi:hypothetical protein MKW98_006824, partial [Papaver atlanticum]
VIRANLLSFSDEDFPPEGKEHNQALQITVGCQGYYVPHVLIDNGSAVKFCTLVATKKIEVRDEDICFRSDNARTVRGFDNEKRCVIGEFTTIVVIGPAHTNTTFLVIDINASFTMFLRRTWLHANLAVSSNLHQKLRFIFCDNMTTIQGDLEEEQGKGKNNYITIPTVETNMVDKNYMEENVNQVFYKTLSKEKLPSWFEHGHTKVAHYLRKYRFFPDMGLGLRGNGRTEPLDGQQAPHEAPYGLGYKPQEEDRLNWNSKSYHGIIKQEKIQE